MWKGSHTGVAVTKPSSKPSWRHATAAEAAEKGAGGEGPPGDRCTGTPPHTVPQPPLLNTSSLPYWAPAAEVNPPVSRSSPTSACMPAFALGINKSRARSDVLLQTPQSMPFPLSHMNMWTTASSGSQTEQEWSSMVEGYLLWQDLACHFPWSMCSQMMLPRNHPLMWGALSGCRDAASSSRCCAGIHASLTSFLAKSF